MKIYAQPNGKMTEVDRLQIATILVKAGYTVKINQEKFAARSVHVIEATE